MTTSRSARLLALLLASAGAAHFVAPSVFERIIPPQLGHERELVIISGIAELVCAVFLLRRSTTQRAALGAAVLFVVVFPANIYMAIDQQATNVPSWVSWLRLPFQPLLIWWAIQVGRRND